MSDEKKTGFLKKVVFALIPALVLFALLEGAARVLPPVSAPDSATAFMGDEKGLFVEDPLLMWRVRGNLESPHSTNAGGFRDSEFSVKKESGEFRVIVLGDSTTWGWGVGDDEVFPARLESFLGEKLIDRNVNVMNAGVPGYTSYQGRLLFETELKKYKPDLVITYFGVNDVTSRKGTVPDSAVPAPSPGMARVIRLLRHSMLYTDARNLMLRAKSAAGDGESAGRRTLSRRVSPEEFETNMAAIRESSRAGGAEVLNVIPLWTFRDEIDNNLRLVLFSDKGTYIEKEESGPLYAAEPSFDPLPVFQDSGLPAVSLFRDYCHFTPAGHALLAMSLAEYIAAKPEHKTDKRKAH